MAVTKVKNDGVDFSEASSIAFDTTTLFVDATNNRVGVGTITPSTALDVTGDVTIGGSLTVNGTTTTINSTTLTVDDLNVVLASGAASAAAADGAGITVDGASATLTYVNSGDKWQFNKAVDVTGTVTADGLTMDTSADSVYSAVLGANRTVAGTALGLIKGSWNGTTVAQINLLAGSDTTNKDDGRIQLRTSNSGGSVLNRFQIDENGDIGFYEDTGTTQKFFWDASAEALGIGTTSPSYELDIQGVGNSRVKIKNTSVTGESQIHHDGNGDLNIKNTSNRHLRLLTNNTEYMRIDSSGNVGIGTSSPAHKLHTYQTVNSNSVNTAVKFEDAGTTGGTSYQHRIAVTGKSGTGNILIGMTDTSTSHFSGLACDFVAGDTLPFYIVNLSSQPLIFGTNTTERMRIESGGKVLIGTTTSGSGTLRVDGEIRVIYSGDSTETYTGMSSVGSYFGTASAKPVYFETSGSERMRIDASGTVMVGTTDASVYNNSGSGTGINLQSFGNIAVARDGNDCMVLNRLNSDGGILLFNKNGSTVGSVSVSSSGTTYTTTSDITLKENINPIADGKEKLLAMKPSTFNFIADEDKKVVYGFIAQEMEQVLPEAVSEGEDGIKSMDYGRITPIIVAALQDALKEIEELKTQINQMEKK